MSQHDSLLFNDHPDELIIVVLRTVTVQRFHSMSSSSYSLFLLVAFFFSFFRVVHSFQAHRAHSFRVSNIVADRRKKSLKMYWNRESSTRSQFDDTITAPIVQSARIISVSDIHDPANDVLHRLVKEDSNNNKDNPIQLVAMGEDFDIQELKRIQPNVIFMSHPTKVHVTF